LLSSTGDYYGIKSLLAFEHLTAAHALRS